MGQGAGDSHCVLLHFRLVLKLTVDVILQLVKNRERHPPWLCKAQQEVFQCLILSKQQTYPVYLNAVYDRKKQQPQADSSECVAVLLEKWLIKIEIVD